jgi:alpha-tubulin suppressor-like RCC1 family protein
MKRRLRAGWTLLLLAACASCITFPDNSTPIVPKLDVSTPYRPHVGDTMVFSARVLDQGGNELYADGVPLLTWSFPRGRVDSVEISDDGRSARFRARTAGPVTLMVRTYPTASMPADSQEVNAHVRYPWDEVSAGGAHTCARSSFGEAFCWGEAVSGAAGIARPEPLLAPAQVTLTLAAPQGLGRVSAGGVHSCATQWVPGAEYRAFCWGGNGSGQLGNGSDAPGLTPLPATVLGPDGVPIGVFRISSGDRHTCALGSLLSYVYCWGAGEAGQLGTTSLTETCGDAELACSTRAIRAETVRAMDEIHAGGNSTCGVIGLGEAHCWGDNTFGQTGTGDTARSVPVPRRMDTALLFDQLDVGATHACAVTASNVAYCWGSNRYGELGVRHPPDLCGAVPCSRRPVAVAGGSISFTHIQAGNGFTCAISVQRVVYCWGRTDYGQAGSWYTEDCGGVPCSPLPQSVVSYATTLAAGDAHACMTDLDQDVYCWGRNNAGQLGDGTTFDRYYAIGLVEPAVP